VIGSFPRDISATVVGDLSLKLLFSHFIISSAHVSLARIQENPEQQQHHYQLVRKNIAAFNKEVGGRLPLIEQDAREDLLDRLATMLAFDFEGAVYLQEWDDLGDIVLQAKTCNNLRILQTMADCLLRSATPLTSKSAQYPVMKILDMVNLTSE
jgi:hypothetical protein